MQEGGGGGEAAAGAGRLQLASIRFLLAGHYVEKEVGRDRVGLSKERLRIPQNCDI